MNIMPKKRAMSLSFSMTAETIEKIEQISKNNDLNRSELIVKVFSYFNDNPDKLKEILKGV